MGNDYMCMRYKATIPPSYNAPDVRAAVIADWTEKSIRATHIGIQGHGLSTLPIVMLETAAEYFCNWLQCGHQYTVLEVFSGNCVASSLFVDAVNRYETASVKWIATDICDYPSRVMRPNMTFDKLHAADAVAKYGPHTDILLMISPPISTLLSQQKFADYYACYDFIEIWRAGLAPKYLVFVGEIGGADGSWGMYDYLFRNEHLRLVLRAVIDTRVDLLNNEYYEELIVFEIV